MNDPIGDCPDVKIISSPKRKIP